MIKKLQRLLKKRNSGGFTLVEVVISTALLGILIIGVLLFMTPVFGMLETNEDAAKADRVVSTVETYISKSLRGSLYIKVYTNTNASAGAHVTGGMITDADFQKMVTFMNTGSNKNNYQLNCLSLKYVTDNNPRNNSQNATAKKYMLFNEAVDPTQFILQPSSAKPVFDESFYEDIYPKFSFSHLDVYFDSTGKELTADEVAADPSKLDKTLTPALIMDILVYNDESMNDVYRIFTGKSIIEANLIKSTAVNTGGEYKIFDNTEHAAGDDIFIFYITRKPKVATPVTP